MPGKMYRSPSRWRNSILRTIASEELASYPDDLGSPEHKNTDAAPPDYPSPHVSDLSVSNSTHSIDSI
jgi:hypothetical protein